MTRVHPLKAGGGGGEGSPGTSPLQELRDDWDRGIRSLRGKGGKKTSVCYPQADSRWDSSENLELTCPGQGLTTGFFPKDILKKPPQGLAVLVGLSP